MEGTVGFNMEYFKKQWAFLGRLLRRGHKASLKLLTQYLCKLLKLFRGKSIWIPSLVLLKVWYGLHLHGMGPRTMNEGGSGMDYARVCQRGYDIHDEVLLENDMFRRRFCGKQ